MEEDFNLDDMSEEDINSFLDGIEDDEVSGGIDDINGQFDLAQMYINMEDNESARTILEEISERGNEEQKRKAQELMAEIA